MGGALAKLLDRKKQTDSPSLPAKLQENIERQERQLLPCEGEAHVGETNLSREDLDGLHEMLESDDVTRTDVLVAIKALQKSNLTSELDRNLVLEAEEAMKSEGSRSQSMGRAIQLLLLLLERVFPKQ
jgi:hypothetical protein